MAENISTISYLMDPDTILLDKNGNILTSGYVEYYLAGTSTKYVTYSNFDGTKNQFRIIIPPNGRIRVLGSNLYVYDEYVYDKYGNLVYSRNNISLDRGAINISGYMTTISNLDGNLDIAASQSGDNLNYSIDISDSYTNSIYSGIYNNSSNIASLSSDLSAEIIRANQAEIASRTLLYEGSNIDIQSGTNILGQYVYHISAQAGTDIISNDGSININSGSIGDVKVYDLSIAESDIARNYIKAETTKGTIAASAAGVTMSFSTKVFGDLNMSNGKIVNTNNLSNVHAELDFEFPNYATDVSFHEVGIAIYNGTSLVSSVRNTFDGSVQHHVIQLDSLINGAGTVSMKVYSDSSISLSNATATICVNDETSRNIASGSTIGDHKVQVDSTSNAGYLNEVISAASPLTSFVSGDRLVLSSNGSTDTYKVKSYSDDTVPNYLIDKVESTDESISISNDTVNQKVNLATTYPGAGSVNIAYSFPLAQAGTILTFPNSIAGSYYNEIFFNVQPVGNLKLSSTSKLRFYRTYNAYDSARITLYHFDDTNSRLVLVGYSDLYTSYEKTGLVSVPITTLKDSNGNTVSSIELTGGDFYYIGIIVKSYTLCGVLGSTISYPVYQMPLLQLGINDQAVIFADYTVDTTPAQYVSYGTTTQADTDSVCWCEIIA